MHFFGFYLEAERLFHDDYNIHEIEAAYKAKGARGNFAYVSFANENQQRDTPLKEGEKPLPIYRGEKAFVSYSGLLDINE